MDTSEEEEASINKPKETFEATQKMNLEDFLREKREKQEEQSQRCDLRKEVLLKMQS